MNGELPTGWVDCTFGDVVKVRNGYAFPSKSFKVAGVPLIRQSNLAGERVSLKKCVYLDPKWLEAKSDFVLRKNDLLIGMSGSVGKICVYDLDEPALQNQRTGKMSLPSKELVDWRFIFEYLRTVQRQLLEKGKGLGILNVSASDIGSLPFRLAPLGEQRRIAAKLEKLLGKVDSCNKRLEKIPVILKGFRQSVLAAACSGRLTADWREPNEHAEPVGAILERIRKRRLENPKLTPQDRSKIKSIYSYTEGGDSASLPGCWQYVALDKLCESLQYGTSRKSEPTGKVAVLRMGNIQGGEIDWTDLVFTSDEQDIRKYSLAPGTVLFNRTNSPELVGKTAIYRGQRPAIFAGYLIRINQFTELNPDYLNYCLNITAAREYCLAVKTDGVSQSNINAQKLSKFEVPLCPAEEQHEIVRRVESLFALADQIETRYQKAKAHVDKLTQSILAKAFRGELVPEDPNDEPASKLLERIRSERNDKASPKRKKRLGQ